MWRKEVNIILDIGNTLTKICIISDKRIQAYYKVDRIDVPMLKNIFDTYPQLRNGIYYNSGQDLTEEKAYLKERLSVFINFDHTTSTPIENLYETPETLGLDRLAGAIGASSYFPRTECMIIDFGTAITFDFISKGKYLGGNISPGLEMRFKSLHYFTAKLPLLKNSDTIKLMGKNTKEAIITGIQLSILGEIDYYMRNNPDYKVIFTGGDAFYFARKIKIPIFVINNLPIVGLNKVLEYNVYRD